jgi:hypothetical protein
MHCFENSLGSRQEHRSVRIDSRFLPRVFLRLHKGKLTDFQSDLRYQGSPAHIAHVMHSANTTFRIIQSEMHPPTGCPFDCEFLCGFTKSFFYPLTCLGQSWEPAVTFFCWRSQEAQWFGIVSPWTELIKPLSKCPGLSEAQQIEFVERIDTVDLPPNNIHILEGALFILLRNIDTWSGLAKRRRCRAIQMKAERWFFSSRTVKSGHWRKLK